MNREIHTHRRKEDEGTKNFLAMLVFVVGLVAGVWFVMELLASNSTGRNNSITLDDGREVLFDENGRQIRIAGEKKWEE